MPIISHGCSIRGWGGLLCVYLQCVQENIVGCRFDSNFIEVQFNFKLVKNSFSRGRALLCHDEGVGWNTCVLMKLRLI